MWDLPQSVAEIKSIAGRTSRGLTLRQLRDVLRACGLEADAVFFDRRKIETYPCSGVVLLDRGHYVVVRRYRSDHLEVFDPAIGWAWVKRRRLARAANGFGIQIRGRAPSAPRSLTAAESTNRMRLARPLLRRVGIMALVVFAVAQLITLLLPLVSKESIDAVTRGRELGFVPAVGLGFILVSLTSTLTSQLGQMLSLRATQRAQRALGREVFDHLAGMPHAWFETNRPSTIQNKVSSAEALLSFAADFFRSISGIAVSLIVGALALFYISPWLALPGLCSLAVSVAIDLMFNQSQREQIAATLEVSQRKQAFNLDLLAQMPLFARFGTLRRSRALYGMIVSQGAVLDAKMQTLRSWRTLAGSAVKSSETLVFVSLAAAFMHQGGYTLGAFVALGSYKDLLAQSMATLFQLRQRNKALEIHRLQTRDLAGTPSPNYAQQRVVECGQVRLENTSFRYGSLDALVLQRLNLAIDAGECIAIKGPSGAGKSTLAKLLAGVLLPTDGRVLIDSEPPLHPMHGFGAVLQGDRLITGSIRDNVTLFRMNVSDEDVEKALRTAEIYEWVMSLPMRLNTVVADSMTGISGGQKQRLLIARAVLETPRLLLLDEATASLEVEVERKILETLRSTGATLILIAHRPEVWTLADRIVSLNADGTLELAVDTRRAAS